ncbi:MAG TPA: hypothetical protein ENK26_06990 [Gammaproteobacteria bacterium]|nr:hypothetical protein [Gammaproteobacteria bacterium]
MKRHAALLNMIGVGLNALTLPVFIALLTPAEYGLWILVSSIASFTALFEFGLSLSMQRAVADGNLAEQHWHSLKIMLYSGLGIVLLSLLGSLYFSFSHSTRSVRAPLSAALNIAICAEGLSNVNGVYQGVFFARGESHKVGLLRICTALLRLTLIWLAIRAGFGVAGIAWAVLLTQAAETLYFSPHILRHLGTPGDQASRWRKGGHRYRISLNQWLLNLGQRFGFRALLLVIGASPAPMDSGQQAQATDAVLTRIARMTIVYRAFEFLHLIIKSATPAYYQHILTETRPVATRLATRTLVAAYALSVVSLLGPLAFIRAENLPDNLRFLQSSTVLIIVTASYFGLRLVMEPLQYRAMMRERMVNFPIIQLALFFTPILIALLSGLTDAVLILLSLAMTSAMYLLYLARQNRSLDRPAREVLARGFVSGIATAGMYSIPLAGLTLIAVAAQRSWLDKVALALMLVYTAAAIFRVLRSGSVYQPLSR